LTATLYRSALFYLVALAAVIGVDQWVKYLVETQLDFEVREPVVPFLSLYLTYNDGIAFSLLRGVGDLGLIAVSVMIIAFVVYLALRTGPGYGFARIGFVLIVGGALGNLIDRAIHGHVIDYIMFHTETWSFAIFNLADAFISVGAALVVLEELVSWLKERRAR
jgi:signal peptidase II